MKNKQTEEGTMGINGWYLTENNKRYSSYTDFTNSGSSYTDFTAQGNRRQVNKRTVRKAPAAKARAAKKKQMIAARILFALICILIVAIAALLLKDAVVDACTNLMTNAFAGGTDSKDNALHLPKKSSEEAFRITVERTSYDKSSPAYEAAENVMAVLKCDNDIDTAWAIFNWVHSNVYYQPVFETMSFEDAAYQGFTRHSGDCFVSFACSKMLLDCAGIPNLMVERYPVYTNSHYWNLVQLNGEWYHCDATVFKDHPDLYFMCTDEEIGDDHHSFNEALYPERASYNQSYYGEAYIDDYYDDYDGYVDDSYDGYDGYVDDSYDGYDGYVDDPNDGYDDSYDVYVENFYYDGENFGIREGDEAVYWNDPYTDFNEDWG